MKNLVSSLKEKLAKTRNGFVGKIAEAVKLRGKVDAGLIEQIEEILIEADLGVELSMDLVEKLETRMRLDHIDDSTKVMDILKSLMLEICNKDLYTPAVIKRSLQKGPEVLLFVGVNGVGKTTTIGKLASQLKEKGASVLLAAGDTFRAAAIEQLSIWSERSGVQIIKQQPGSDPSAVVFDAVASALNRKIDYVLIDTAGRLHNKSNLMNELNKISRTIKKLIPDGPHQTYLVIDATTGQNAVSQAKTFNETVKLDGIVLTKLDGTAKGGIVMSIKNQLGIPVKYIGVGEKIEDLKLFNPQEFIEAIF